MSTRVPLPALRLTRTQRRIGKRRTNSTGDVLALETGIAPAIHDALQAGISGDEFERVVEEGAVVSIGGGVEQMDAGEIAVAATGSLQPRGAANRKHLGGETATAKPAEEKVEPDAVGADDDEVGRPQPHSKEADFNAFTGFEVFALARNRDESIRTPKRRHRS